MSHTPTRTWGTEGIQTKFQTVILLLGANGKPCLRHTSVSNQHCGLSQVGGPGTIALQRLRVRGTSTVWYSTEFHGGAAPLTAAA